MQDLLEKDTQAVATHTMVIADPNGTRTIEWNGEPEQREVAEAAFTAAMSSGLYLAYTQQAATPEAPYPPKQQVRKFDAEAEKTWLAPRLVGG